MTGTDSTVFVAYSKDRSVRRSSSSGGIFSLIAETVLKENGVVFGAAYDKDFSVHHISIESGDRLPLLQGSKYLQSRTENTFEEAKTELDKGRTVLFSGTGCQIAGLKGFLKKDYSNLITVDILCHGVPSPLVWQKYLSEMEKRYNSTVSAVSFRNKETGWKNYSVTLRFTDDQVYKEDYHKNLYMRLFLEDICLRPSCHVCRFKEGNHQSDITLGDCWGITEYDPEMDDDGGTSLLLVHTKKGKDLVDKISSGMVMKSASLDKISQPMIYNSAPVHPNRSKFFVDFQKNEGMDHLSRDLSLSISQKVLKRLHRLMSGRESQPGRK